MTYLLVYLVLLAGALMFNYGCHMPTEPPLTAEQVTLATDRMAEARADLHTLEDVHALMSRVKTGYHQDDWPTIAEVFAYDLTGNCMTAAVLGRWALGCIGMPADIYSLWAAGETGHAIAVSRDGSVIISNQMVLTVESGSWRDAVKALPGLPVYERIEKEDI